MKKVLLVIHHDAFGRQMARWAHVLKHQGDWEPIIYISAGYMWRHVTDCRAEGISVLSPDLDPPPANVGEEKVEQVQPRVQQRLKDTLRQVPGLRRFVNVCRQLGLPFRIFSTMSVLSKQCHFVRHIIQKHRINVLLIAESCPDYGAPIYIHAAHREGIPVVTATLEQAKAHAYADTYLTANYLNIRRPLNRFVAAFYPRWVIAHRGRQLIRTEPTLLLALELLRMAPTHPWQMVGNQEDMVAVDSQAMLYHYISEGVALQQMAIVGRSEHDLMKEVLGNAKKLKTELYNRLGLPANRPMLLSPLVQEHYVSGCPECDFQDYEKMVEFWVKSLGAVRGYNVVVNLHPGHTYQQDPHAWDYIEQWGVKICNQDLATLIPLCDIYVAAGSSTIPWAIACGKPVINYNIYRYPNCHYPSAPGVLTVCEQHEFVSTLNRLTSDPVYYEEIAARQATCAEYWGQLDGDAGGRLVRLFDQLVENYRRC
jgi:hypothetical protein